MHKLWTPTNTKIEKTQMYQFFQEFLGDQEYDYELFHQKSVENNEAFWSLIWDKYHVKGEKGNPPFIVPGKHISETQWFPEATLNFAENLLSRKDDKVALVGRYENGDRKSITNKELYKSVARLAYQMRLDGVEKGDRIAGFVPNCIEAIVAMLATTSIGAIWTSCSPDFGYQGVLDRFGQVAPKMIFTANAYSYNGKKHGCLEKVHQLAEQISSIEKIIVFEYLDYNVSLEDIVQAVRWNDYTDNNAKEIDFEQVEFNHPLYIMYSSGTTGQPKCIVHRTGGVLLEHIKELRLHVDLSEEDVFFYYSTCGWMMWNWLVSGLVSGCTLILADGSPFYPSPNYLIDLIDEENISIFGVSAKYISALEKADIHPMKTHRLEKLRSIHSTGSPLSVESFHYVYNSFKKDVVLSSISGGTDLIGCFASGNPTVGVYAGELQCKGLALDLDVLDDNGQSVRQEKGELVCKNPFPTMPLYFWNDEGNKRYHNAYYSRFDNIWAQGDFAEITSNNGMIIYGRSDAVLNPGGVRIGTAEIYRQAMKVESVKECIAVGQDWKDDCRVVLFVVMKDGFELNHNIQDEIRNIIRKNATPRHVPSKVIEVTDIPKTRSGKIVELAVRNVIHGRAVKNTDALQNPEALELYKDLKELQK
ncbi:acetoacetate--CoA ligase [Flammeovirga yaeyamensis]|uniref:Acetoacetate--CoA ligase n=1 Tax=Flammeovirga yaeyamensis TaxID=367791 RepID=A0AAX1NBG0_9BACT|nr:acetoacetate--CoA ligase [Flammeovirga yaeyamensis]MBB3697178.1 acetoacetyl-CoA synthetase [Flammeovirga yaeyamensis]NMF33838.1 acetoacetate--CoA ligase [Flammeovirga yaeyamensis]QWG04899.1 acetoacetate--CoA ligase [Flammeovirga yaeyamensis]